jgi:hypothetical protein
VTSSQPTLQEAVPMGANHFLPSEKRIGKIFLGYVSLED